jgi:hypothetical protein
MANRRLLARPFAIAVAIAPLSIVALFGIVFLFGDQSNLPAALEKTNWWFFLPVPLTLPLFYCFHALRFAIGFRSISVQPPRLWDLGRSILCGNMVNAIIPGMGGEVVSSYLVSRFHSVSMPHMLATSAYTKVVGLTVNVGMALAGVILMPESDDPESIFGPKTLIKGALVVLLAGLALALLFPRAVRVGTALMRRLLRLGEREGEPGRFRALAARVAEGLDRTADHFVTLRKGGLGPAVRICLATVLINLSFSGSLVLGFLAVGYVPVLYEVLMFYSVLTIVFFVAMIFLMGMAATELTAIAFWSQLTGLSVSEILVAMLAVKMWQAIELALAALIFYGYARRIPEEEFRSIFKRSSERPVD